MPLMMAASAQAGPALPTGGKVVSGAATIGQSSGSGLVINQSTSKAIINWNGFSIGQGGTVQFNNGSGATLNRVTGGAISAIDGLLSGTGSVYLINPNGVIIGKTGVVNVGGTFVASTLDVSDANFLAGGGLSFTGASSAPVINLGKIGSLGGDVAMMAARVENDGAITAANGVVGLVAGHGVLLRDAALDDGKFSVLVGGSDTSVTNSGLISAANAELRAEGGNVYALAGDTAGVIRATGVKSGDGKVWLVAEGGTLDVAGTIVAQGANGAGGQIETSGQTVSLGAAKIDAHGGAWLVDPTDLTIDTTAASTIDSALNAGTSVTEQTTATGSSGAGTINASGSGDIILAAPLSWSTAANLTLSAYRNVDVGSPITSTGAGSLTLQADNTGAGVGTVNFTGSGTQVTASGGGSVSIFYNPAGNNSAAVNTTSYTAPTGYSGSVSVTGGGVLTSYMLVNTLSDLQNVQNNLGGTYALGRDIDASATAGGVSFAPIGSGASGDATTEFTGLFDGQSHTVSNLTINLPQATDVGLFGYVGTAGVVRNVNLAGGSVSGAYSVGALAGENDGLLTNATASTSVTAAVYDSNGDGGSSVGGLVGYNTGTINQSSASGAVSGYTAVAGLVGIDAALSSGAPGVIENSFATGQVTTGSGLAGGLVGQVYGSGAIAPQLINDHATGSVIDNGVFDTDSPGQDGGLVGDMLSGVVTGSYATGAVTSLQGYAVGGLIGYAGRTGDLTISDSYATGSVATFNDAGGLIGEVRAPENDPNVSRPGVLTITNSYATGSAVASSYDAGGLIGGLYQEAQTSGSGAYGPAVSNANTIISNVFATGYVSTPTAAGGLIGKNPGTVTVTNGYYATDTTGQSTDAAGATGQTTSQLQSALPTGFDPATWGLVTEYGNGVSYPYLLSQFATGATPEVISGQAFAGAGAPVGVIRNGLALGQVDTGANNYYYLLAAPSGAAAPQSGAPADSILTYLVNASTPGVSFVQTNISNPQATGLNIFVGTLLISTVQSSLSAVVASLAPDAAVTPAGALNFTLPNTGGVATTNGARMDLLTAGDFALDGNLNLGSGGLNLGVNGALTQTAGVITADSLTGSATSVNLPDANLVNTLGTSYGVGLTATNGLVFTNAQALTVAGPVSGGTGQTAVTTTVGDMTIGPNGSVTGDLTLSAAGDLDINGNVAATDGALNLEADSAGTGAGALNIASGVTISTINNAPINIYADSVSDSGVTFSTTSGGSTVAATPTIFQYIYTLAELQAINTNLSGDYALNANIDASATGGASPAVTFTPIGGSNGFSGMFDGLSHTINGLTINDTTDSYVGLFGLVTGTVQNVNLTAANITGGDSSRTGGLVGWLVSGSLLNSSVSGVVNGGQNSQIGGLVGYAEQETTSNSSASASVSGGSGSDVGGLVGYQIFTGSSITGSFATGTVSISGNGGFAGGLVGDSFDGSIGASYATGAVIVGSGGIAGGLVGINDRASIATSFATGAVTDGGTGALALGGLVGYNTGEGATASISQSFATGAVAGAASYVGGLVGVNAGFDVLNRSYIAVNDSSQYAGTASITDAYATGAVSGAAGADVGGLVGYNYGGIDNTNGTGTGTSTISNAYAIGAVSGGTGSNLGGLVGFSSASGGVVSITNGYFDTQTTGQAADGGNDGTAGASGSSYTGATGYTTAQFIDDASFDNNFAFGSGPFPYLTPFYATAPQSLSGVVYGANGLSPLASGAAGAQTVSLLSGGGIVGSATTGADGFYSIVALPTLTNGAFATAAPVSGPALTYLTGPSSLAPTGARLDTTIALNDTQQNDIWSGVLFAPTRAITLSTAPTSAAALLAADGRADLALLTTATGANTALDIGVAGLANVGYIATAPTFTVDVAPAGSLYVSSASGGIVVNTAAPLSVADGTVLELSAPAGSLSFDTSVNVGTAGGTGGALRLGASAGDYGFVQLSFAPGVSVNYLATDTTTGAPLGALSINGQAYTLLNSIGGANAGGVLTPDSGSNDLAGIANNTAAGGIGGYYALVSDVSQAAGTSFSTSPINQLNGALEGLGHTITGLTINSTTGLDTGLIAVNYGSVSDLSLLNATVTAVSTQTSSGGGTSYSYPEVGLLAGDNEGHISNVRVTGSVSVTGGPAFVGGLVGVNDGPVINASANVSAYAVGGVAYSPGFSGGGGKAPTPPSYSAQYAYVGGLAGENDDVISNSRSAGVVTAGTYTNAGGLVGANYDTITESYSTGAVSGGSGATVPLATSPSVNQAGGLVGFNNGIITSAYATGAVSGGSNVVVGGLVGDNNGGIQQAYATGYVSAAPGGTGTMVGGLIGDNTNADTTGGSAIVSAYFDTTTTGQTVGLNGTANANVTGLTTAQLQGTLPDGFDPDIWSTDVGLYPYLGSFFPGGVQALTATTQTGAAGGQAAFYAAGGPLGDGTTSVGADGSIYQLVAAGSAPAGAALGDTLTLPGATAPSGLGYTDMPTFTGQVVVGPTVTSGLISASTQETGYGALLADVGATFGPLNYAALEANLTTANLQIQAANAFTIDQAISGSGSAAISAGGNLTVASPITSTAGNISLAGIGALSLGADVSAASGTVDLAGLSVSQTAGVLTAATLTGAVTNGASLNDANAVATLGAFSAGGSLSLTDATALTVSGAVTAGGALTLNETGGALTVGSGGGVVATGALALQASGDVDVAGSVAANGTAGVTLFSGETGTGTGTVNLTGTVSSAGPVTILYNPNGAGQGYAGANASTYANGTDTNPFSAQVSGGGVTTAYMLVNNVSDLQLVSTNLAGVYTPFGNIDASSTATAGAMANNAGLGFTPIGNGLTGAFTGLFNGRGYTISGLTETPVVGTSYVGLFGAVGAGGIVENLRLTNVAITGYGYTGGLVGDLSGALTNVSVSGTVGGLGGTGGLVGVAESGSTISRSRSTASVNSTSGDDVGGLAGASFGTIATSSSSGAVTASTGDHVGGLIGYNLGTATNDVATGAVQGVDYVGGLIGLNYAVVSGSRASGSVNGAEYVGGLAGWNDVSGAISGSYALGSVTGTATAAANSGDYVGGLIGVNEGSITTSFTGAAAVNGAGLVGGLVGLNRGTISASYTSAPTTGDLYVGGLVGWNDAGASVTTSVANGSVTGLAGGQDAGGNDYVGGAVGVNFGSLSDSYATGAVSGVKVVGGLVGTNMPGGASVTTSYATGAVSATNGAAGAVFGVNAGEVTSVYGFPGLSGQPVASGYLAPGATGDATLLTGAQETSQAAYAGFNFNTTWAFEGGYTPYGTPTLQSYYDATD